MKFTKTLALAYALIAVAAIATSASAQITFFTPSAGDPEPTENVIFDGVVGGGGAATLINPAAAQGARGSNFVIGAPGTATEIGGVTFQANQARTYAGETMTIVIFSGDDFTGVDFEDVSPTGLAAAPGISILYEETLDLPDVSTAGDYLVINFASSITVDSGDTLGVMAFSSIEFSQIEGSNNGGGRLLFRESQFGGTSIDPSGARNFRFSILSPASPPSDGDIVPTMFTTFRGIVLSAGLSDFTGSDDADGSFNPGFTINDTEAPVWLIFDGNGAAATAIQVESSAGTPGLEYTVEAFNWAANAFDVVGMQAENFNVDQVVPFSIVPADHVDANGDLRTRVGWRQAGFIINFPWQVNVDQVVWTQ